MRFNVKKIARRFNGSTQHDKHNTLTWKLGRFLFNVVDDEKVTFFKYKLRQEIKINELHSLTSQLKLFYYFYFLVVTSILNKSQISNPDQRRSHFRGYNNHCRAASNKPPWSHSWTCLVTRIRRVVGTKINRNAGWSSEKYHGIKRDPWIIVFTPLFFSGTYLYKCNILIS